MPNCAFCGAELPNNARFCGNCGQVPRAIAEQTPNMRVSPMQSIPAPLLQQTSRADEEQQRIPQAAPAALSTMASSQTPSPSGGNQPPPTNGAQTPGSLPRVSGPQSRRPKWMGNVPLHWL
ncbi:MAG TPA: zinc-ribbon domain-containing protein, partial [Ktedonobacteraceae bacterium]|nr:zinc-ribbon domain-containing protein [Ktedonobacteraceae bacterium]